MRKTWKIELSVVALGLSVASLSLGGCGGGTGSVIDADMALGDMAQGPPTGDMAGTPSSDLSSAPASPVVLTDVTSAAGLPAYAVRCLAMRDFDHDAHPDILLGGADDQFQYSGQLLMHHNRGDGTFARSTIATTGITHLRHCAVGDFDNDGWLDIALGGENGKLPAIVLLRNTGTTGLEFTDVTGGANALVATGIGPVEALGFFDADNDGFPELFVGFWPDSQLKLDCEATASDFACMVLDGSANYRVPMLLHNEAGAKFTAAAWPSGPQMMNAVSFFDWDGDGNIDVFQCDDFGENNLYRNVPGAAPTELLDGLHADPFNHGMGVALADFNHDGLWDLYVADAGPDQLYFGKADGTIEDGAAAAGIADPTRFHSGWSPLAEDFDNDGWADLFITNAALMGSSAELGTLFMTGPGGNPPSTAQADFLFTNQGAGGAAHNPGGAAFTLTRFPNPGVKPLPIAAGAAAADYDGDGLVDVLEVIATSSLKVRLLHNETKSTNHWVAVRLVGKGANHDAIGAVVLLHDGSSELDRRTVGAGGPGNSPDVSHFGLGARSTVPGLTVRWPGGQVQEVAPSAVDQIIEVTQN